MLKKLIDTNIFIDRFLNPDSYRDIFLSQGLTYLSAVVFMELRAGAHTGEAVKAVYDLYGHFTRVGQIGHTLRYGLRKGGRNRSEAANRKGLQHPEVRINNERLPHSIVHEKRGRDPVHAEPKRLCSDTGTYALQRSFA